MENTTQNNPNDTVAAVAAILAQFGHVAEQAAQAIVSLSTTPPAPSSAPTLPVAVPVRRNGRRMKRDRRTKALVTEQTLSVAIAISRHPEGIRAGAISKETGIPREKVGVCLGHVVRRGLAKMSGVKSASTYYPS